MRKVIVMPYDSIWQHLYLDEARKLNESLNEAHPTIHHIGGTAVPGLSASPVIDILMIVGSVEHCKQAIESMGYTFDTNLNGGHRYKKGTGEKGYHLYVYPRNDEHVLRYIALKDYLRTFSGEMERYDHLKRQLAKLYPFDRYAYREGKRIFVEVMEVKAINWYESEGHQHYSMIS